MKLFAIAYILLTVWVALLLARVEALEEKVKDLRIQQMQQDIDKLKDKPRRRGKCSGI